MMAKNPLEVLDMIMADTRADAEKFDGQPFTGKVVAQYFGNHGAAISALARILKELIEINAKRDPFKPPGPCSHYWQKHPDRLRCVKCGAERPYGAAASGGRD
jgi:hypothetical protein